MKKYWKDFGILLKTERQRNQMSRKELAEKTHKKESTVISWEQGYRRPKQQSFLDLHNILGTPIQELQKAAGHTPEFDWYISFTEKTKKKSDILLSTDEEEKEELRRYLRFLRFRKLIVLSKQ